MARIIGNIDIYIKDQEGEMLIAFTSTSNDSVAVRAKKTLMNCPPDLEKRVRIER